MLKSNLLKGAVIVVIVLFSSHLYAQQEGKEAVLLDTSSFWRCHYSLNMPVVRKGEDIVPLHVAFKEDWQRLWSRFPGHGEWLQQSTPFPLRNWTDPDFDDRSWCRVPGTLVASTASGTDRLSPYMALECRRGKFRVTDPARVRRLSVSLEFRGGAIVYLNGKEVRRGYLAEGKRTGFDEPAEDYKAGAPLRRSLTDIDVPVRFLRKGVNVLAVEIHRSPNAETDVGFRAGYGTFYVKEAKCGLEKFRLEAPSTYAGALVPNVARPDGFQVWNSSPTAPDFDLDYGDPNEPLRPVRIAATLNATASGKIVVGSSKPIAGLHAVVSDLVAVNAKGSIPAAQIEVRYALPTGYEIAANCRYLAGASRFDGLSGNLPQEVPVREKGKVRRNPEAPGVPLVFGAVVPVWVTVHVPRNAVPANYEGALTIRARGEQPIAVPLRLSVALWTAPDPHKFQTFVEVVQSPESVAMRYGVPLWSKEHFDLVEKSLGLVAQLGNKTAYIPLISETNLGNAETMVRWIRQEDGSYTYDFSVMDRYLDLVEKQQGRPAVVCFYVWDIFLAPTGGYRWGEDRFKAGHLAYGNRGPEVSLLDPGTGRVTKLQLPRHGDSDSMKLWRPLLTAVRDRMKKRGLENAMTLGLVSDRVPRKETVAFFKEILPKIPWAGNSHVIFDNYRRDGLVLKYQSEVFDGQYVPEPSVRRIYGWKWPGFGAYRNIDWVAHTPTEVDDGYPLTTFRFLGEVELLSGFFGFARIGADFWPVLEDKRGRRVGRIAARYPKSSWTRLDIRTALLEPGRKGAIGTARYEMLREGLQEAEARIFIEKALDDKTLRARLGEELVSQCLEVLDERTRTIARAVNTFIQNGDIAYGGTWATSGNCWWQAPGLVGCQWYLGTDGHGATERLYTQAARVAKALGKGGGEPGAKIQ